MHSFRDVDGAYIVRSIFNENDPQRLEIALSVMLASLWVEYTYGYSDKTEFHKYIYLSLCLTGKEPRDSSKSGHVVSDHRMHQTI